MSAALAEKIEAPQEVAAAAMAEARAADGGGDPMIDEVRLGFEELRALSHNDLRDVIARRVEMLDTVLKQREERRAAIETAKLASAMLELRRDRALRIKKHVDYGSAIAAVASTVLIIAIMI